MGSTGSGKTTMESVTFPPWIFRAKSCGILENHRMVKAGKEQRGSNLPAPAGYLKSSTFLFGWIHRDLGKYWSSSRFKIYSYKKIIFGWVFFQNTTNQIQSPLHIWAAPLQKPPSPQETFVLHIRAAKDSYSASHLQPLCPPHCGTRSQNLGWRLCARPMRVSSHLREALQKPCWEAHTQLGTKSQTLPS